MRIKGLKTNETSFKNAQNENQMEDTGQNLGYDNKLAVIIAFFSYDSVVFIGVNNHMYHLLNNWGSKMNHFFVFCGFAGLEEILGENGVTVEKLIKIIILIDLFNH